MLTKRDELLARLTDCLGLTMWAGGFVGHDSGVSLVIRHERVTDFTWDELEVSDDPVLLVRERIDPQTTT